MNIVEQSNGGLFGIMRRRIHSSIHLRTATTSRHHQMRRMRGYMSSTIIINTWTRRSHGFLRVNTYTGVDFYTHYGIDCVVYKQIIIFVILVLCGYNFCKHRTNLLRHNVMWLARRRRPVPVSARTKIEQQPKHGQGFSARQRVRERDQTCVLGGRSGVYGVYATPLAYTKHIRGCAARTIAATANVWLFI